MPRLATVEIERLQPVGNGSARREGVDELVVPPTGEKHFRQAFASARGCFPVYVKARVLVAHGDADSFVPEERIRKFKKALSDAGVTWEMDIYGGAKHSFTNPYADGYGVDGVAYQETADRSAWFRLLRFLDELMGEKTDIEP